MRYGTCAWCAFTFRLERLCDRFCSRGCELAYEQHTERRAA